MFFGLMMVFLEVLLEDLVGGIDFIGGLYELFILLGLFFSCMSWCFFFIFIFIIVVIFLVFLLFWFDGEEGLDEDFVVGFMFVMLLENMFFNCLLFNFLNLLLLLLVFFMKVMGLFVVFWCMFCCVEEKWSNLLIYEFCWVWSGIIWKGNEG